jgi:hypothetical protein
MPSFAHRIGTVAAVATLLGLAACATPPGDQHVASSRPADCPIGTHICRHDSAGPTDAVSADTLRNDGMTNVGGMRPQQMHGTGGS